MTFAVGARFGRLTITGEASPYRTPSGKRHFKVEAACDCGRRAIVFTHHIKSGQTKSCGCLKRESRPVTCTTVTHGDTRGKKHAPEYTSWRGMIQRCENPKQACFKDYGGRGITVCARWRESYAAFLADVGRRPSPAHSLDRYPNNDGAYEPGNVRWATHAEQTENRRARKQKASTSQGEDGVAKGSKE